jgi:hypothetical protein
VDGDPSERDRRVVERVGRQQRSIPGGRLGPVDLEEEPVHLDPGIAALLVRDSELQSQVALLPEEVERLSGRGLPHVSKPSNPSSAACSRRSASSRRGSSQSTSP